jgi:putative transcriptional regulator
MSEKRITRVSVRKGQRPKDRTDWQKLRAMTDEEVRAAAEADPDNPPLTDDEIARLERVPVAKTIRLKLGMTLEEFARTYHLSLSVLRDWEQQRSQPDQAARTLLRVIERSPETVKHVLQETRK